MLILEAAPAWPCAGKDALQAAAQLHLSGFEEVERVVGAAHPTRGPIGDLNWVGSQPLHLCSVDFWNLGEGICLSLVPTMVSHLCSLKEFCTSVSHDCELGEVVRAFQSV